jgi:enterochelin esterase-like enzyme
MEQGSITSSALATNLYGDPATRPYRVYLPPSYDNTAKRYPVVYVLHGGFNDENQMIPWLRPTLDSMIQERSIGEMMAVFVNATNKLVVGSWYLSSPVIGDYETYIVTDLVKLIDTRYRTLDARESRGVTGFSMGGWGTMHLALKFPDVFSVAVAEAGRYNSRSQQADALSRELARFHPTNFTQYMAVGDVDYMLCAFQALFAGLLPNPQRPDLYTDYPYEWVNGQPVLSESADQRCRQGDVQNGDLPRYILQAIRLNGIKIVHGTTDSASPVIHTREFTNALHTAGVQFEYEEHSGGHEYRAALALPFLSSHLQGAERYIAPPRLTLSLATNGLQLVFPTQTNVQYTVESAATLDTSGVNWTERTRVSGDGQTATVESPCQGEAQFFRIRAANLP